MDDRELGPALDLMRRINEAGERNDLVPKGLSGADTLGLRATENAQLLSRRGLGTQEASYRPGLAGSAQSPTPPESARLLEITTFS